MVGSHNSAQGPCFTVSQLPTRLATVTRDLPELEKELSEFIVYIVRLSDLPRLTSVL